MLRALLIAGSLTCAGCNAVFGLDPVRDDLDGRADDVDGRIPSDGRDPIDGRDPTDGRPLGTWSQPVPITNLATPMDEEDPAMSPDGTELYFTSLDGNNGLGYEVWLSRRLGSGGLWGTPQPASLLNTTSNDSSVRLGHDGLTLYVASDRPGTTGNYDLWRSTRVNALGPWSTPARFDFGTLNSLASDRTASPCQGETRFVFASDRNGSGTLSDLYELSGQGLAPVPDAANGGVVEGSPFITEDCLTLYFASSATGGLDLYVMTRTAIDNPWSIPQPITELNTAGLEADPWVSADQRTIVFSYDPTGTGAYDLYMATR